jgi:hypothetical protein
LLAVLVVLNVILCIVVVRFITKSDINCDEVEHAHVTWAMNQGILPYRDIHQIHMPLLWIVFAPIMQCLPQSVEALVALRGVCLLAFVGTYLAGLLILREVLGTIRLTHALIMLLLSLSVFPEFEFYRFRPDPFMTLCTAYGILAAVRLGRAPRRYAFLCGIAFALAASFSPKMAPLCLLVPILCLLECRRLWSLRPLWLVIPNAVGFVVGLLPLAAWLFSFGLFDPFKDWVISINGQALNVFNDFVLPAIDASKLITTLAIAGGLLLVQMKSDAPAKPWAPANALLVAALLAWLMPIVETTHLVYNLQIFAAPGAVLGTVLILKLAAPGTWPWKLQFALLVLAMVYIAEGPAVKGYHMSGLSGSIPMADLQKLIDLCTSDDLTCVAFAEYHPIFCRDATDLYLRWDHGLATMDMISKPGQQVYRAMWPRAIADIQSKLPSFLVDVPMWDRAFKDGLIDQKEFRRLQEIIRSHYQLVLVGRTAVLVRKDLLRSG